MFAQPRGLGDNRGVRPGCTLLLLAASATALFGDVTVRYHSQMKYGDALPDPIGHRTGNGVVGMPEDTEIYRKGDREFVRSGKFACLIDYAKQTVTVIDDEHKQYATAPLGKFVDQMTTALPAMSPEYREAQAGAKSTVSSRKTGRTAKISDVAIEETEYTVAIDVPTPPIPGFTVSGPLLKITMQIWTPTSAEARETPVAREMAGLGLPDGRFSPVMDPARIVAEIYSAMPGLGDAWNQLLQEVAKTKPAIFRYHVEASMPGMAQAMEQQRKTQPNAAPAQLDLSAPFHVLDGELIQLLPQAVDDSIFRIPADYHPAPFADVVKAVEPDYPRS